MGIDNQAENTIVALELLRERFPEAVLETSNLCGAESAVLRPEYLIRAVDFLKNDPRLLFDMLVDITAVDYSAYPEDVLGRDAEASGSGRVRFCVVYQLLSLSSRRRLCLKIRVGGEDPAVDSLTSLWGSANWLEREVWDMFGIRFYGHPDLRRILMYEEFEGHPLRKDYPVSRRQPLIGPEN